MTVADANLADEVTAIKALIQTFFDAINAEDIKALQATFTPGANLTIIRQDPPLPPPPSGDHHHHAGQEDEGVEKLTVVIRTHIEEFIRLLEDSQRKRKGRPGGPVLHETPDLGSAAGVRVDGLFGAAWCPFGVTFDGVLHHYGTMVYTLGRVDGDGGDDGKGKKVWRVEGLTQSYRRTPGWAVGVGGGVSGEQDGEEGLEGWGV